MNRDEPDIEKRYRAEKEKFENETGAWKWCYERFKSKFDKIVEYERKVEKLEAELKDREGILNLGFEKEKNKLLLLMVFFIMVSVIFVGTTSHNENAWILFTAGLGVGVGCAVIFRMLLKSHDSVS
ncbi:MAG: hypothetical protein V3R93_03540 [Candidatus Hydrothermarchaeaceae archaeon]